MFSLTLSRTSALVVGLSLLACGPLTAQTAQAQSASTTVLMKSFDFSPMTLTVPAGTTVTWKNLDGAPHTVTSADGSFRSMALERNDSFAFKFDKPGTYKYICSIHPKMTAAVIVK